MRWQELREWEANNMRLAAYRGYFQGWLSHAQLRAVCRVINAGELIRVSVATMGMRILHEGRWWTPAEWAAAHPQLVIEAVVS